MRRGVGDVALMLVSPAAALLLYALLRPLSESAALAAGIVFMLALAVARRPAGA
jgi:hypothetical protein